MKRFYIQQKLKLVKNIEKYKPSSIEELYATYLKVEDLFQQDNTIIVGGPGNGKSRLLKEVVLSANEQNKRAIFIDLKKVQGSVQEHIDKYIIRDHALDIRTNQDVNQKINTFYKSENFELSNDSSILVCFDALDEVKQENQRAIIEKVKDFHYEYPEVKVFISCRDYVFSKFKGDFLELNPILLEVLPFQAKEVGDFLRQNGFSANQITQIISRFGSRYSIQVINSPRVLEIFVDIAKSKGLNTALKMNKADLLDEFIFRKLEEEDRKLNKDQKDIFRRLLTRLALIMQIYQTRELKKEEVMSFFEDVIAGTGISSMNFELPDFYRRSLLVENEHTVQFENAEFQDYLAAKSIQDIGHINQVTFDLVVNQELNTVYPFWYNTIAYLVSIEPKIQLVILNYIYRRNDQSDFQLITYILTENVYSIEARQKTQVFEKTLIFFQKNNWYLRRENAERLSQYYQSENEQILKNYISNTNAKKHVLTNVLWLISILLEKEKTIDKQFWKQQTARLLKVSRENLVLSMALDASAQFKDLDLLKHNFHERMLIESDNDIIYEYIQACQVAAPNSAYTIDLLFSQHNFRRAPEPNFDKVTSKEGIIYYLNKLAHMQNRGELYRVISKIEQYSVLEAVVENIESLHWTVSRVLI